MSKTKTNFELVLIESSKRASGISTQFNFKLPKPCRDVYQIDLLYASLINTFFTFRIDSSGMVCFILNIIFSVYKLKS